MVDKLKKRALKKRLILRVKNYVETGISYEERDSFIQAKPELRGRIRKMKGKIVVVSIDLLASKTRIVLRKKSGRK